EKPFNCNFCDKQFRQLSTLSNHKKIHTGEKPFECSVCGKQFRQSSTLNSHIRIHSDDKFCIKPFKCSICPKEFRQTTTLANHIKIHTGKPSQTEPRSMVALNGGLNLKDEDVKPFFAMM
uniref:C2H2-type domain-containing protein n=1 Tax=Anopheles arabiensis TaxID=7173 RepID=A0A182I4S6_ANOAR